MHLNVTPPLALLQQGSSTPTDPPKISPEAHYPQTRESALGVTARDLVRPVGGGVHSIAGCSLFCTSCDILPTKRGMVEVNVSMPISTVVPSLDGPVLAVLASTYAPLSLADVHRRAGPSSKSGVRQVLVRMLTQGLVAEVPGGYVLNRDHVAAPAVELLANLHGALAGRIRSAAEAWPGQVLLAGLFGSAARRDGDASSDIDILVVSDDAALDEFADELAGWVRAWTGNPAQVVGLSTAELRRLRAAKEPIVAGWERDLVVLCGDRNALRARR